MSDYIYDAYYIDVPLENASISLTNNISNNPTNSTTVSTNNPNANLSANLNLPTIYHNNSQRFLSEAFWRIYDKFQTKILKEYPDIPCVYCGRLLYKSKATWITYDPSFTYPIELINQV